MFKPHFGMCICHNENRLIVVKKGYCQEGNYNQKQKNKKDSGKLSIKKYSFVKQKTGEANLFLKIWIESNQCCFVCDKPIIYPIASNFMHILPKALNKYPKFKLYPKNIVLACMDSQGSCHSRFDKEPRSSLIEPMWQKLFKLEYELKEEYKSFKNEIIKNKL